MMNGRFTRCKRKLLDWESIGRKMRSSAARSAYILVAADVLLSLIVCLAVTPKRYDLKVGDIAPSSITASKDVVDEISTQRKRDAAAAQVEPIYVFKSEVVAEVRSNLGKVLAEARVVRDYGESVLEEHFPGDPSAQAGYYFTDEELGTARGKLSLVTLADYQLQTLMHMGDAALAELSGNITAAVDNSLNSTIREGYINDSIQYLQQMIAYKTDIVVLQNIVTPILRKVIQPNMVIDQEATEKLKEDARMAVEPVIYKQGQNIVLARELVTTNQMAMLRELGLLDDDTVDVMTYTGGFLIVLVSMCVLMILLHLFDPTLIQRPKKIVILSLILCLTLGLSVLGRLIHAYMVPAMLCAMMLTCLLGVRAGCIGTICISGILCGLIAGGDAAYGTSMANILFTSLVGGFCGVYVLYHQRSRQQVLIAGLLSAVSNVLVILAIGFMTSKSVSDVLVNAMWSAGSCLISAILCIAFCPVFETWFRLATTSKLLELGNPNHPLLRRLMLEAPGTYHHSIMVANLAEAAAEAIHANALMARVGAYFHDIGKLKRPHYFKENQIGENVHDHTSPYISAAIVTAHTHDGVTLAQQNHLPLEIQNIIAEHHGDTPVMFFYHKAVQQADGQPVNMDDFRYDGRKPQTAESAIIMLADTVEAAVRSMTDPTPENIRKFITKLVWGKLEDGQLDNAPLTLRDISRVIDAFCTSLNGIFHERIEYPTTVQDEEKLLPDGESVPVEEPHTSDETEETKTEETEE